MRISEFTQAAERYLKYSLLACVTPFAVAVLCIAVYAPFQHRFEAFLEARVDPQVAAVLTTLPMAIPTVIALISLIPLHKRSESKWGIPCPHCAKGLAAHRFTVIASRNCTNCGKRVLKDDE